MFIKLNETQIKYSITKTGGRHYSDRLCSDRRCSDNPQSGRPSTSLPRLGLCRNRRNLEKTARIWSRRRMHLKRGIDRGTEGSGVWGGYPCGVWGAPYPPEKLQHMYLQYIIVLSLIFGIWFGVFPIGSRYCPQAYSTEVSYPTSRLWTVGIASVGIVWCTPKNEPCLPCMRSAHGKQWSTSRYTPCARNVTTMHRGGAQTAKAPNVFGAVRIY